MASGPSVAVEFHPGVGVAASYSDNVRKTPDNQISDTIASANIGATLKEDKGKLVYDANAYVRKDTYLNDTYEDQRYIGVFAKLNWEMLRDRFGWFLSDSFTQRPINALDSNTPDNRQDVNNFNFGANITFPLTVSQQLVLVPSFSRNFFEISKVSNRQYALLLQWDYQMYRATTVGLNLSARSVEYDDRSISDTTFTGANLIISGQRVNTSYTLKLGATTVKKDSAISADETESSSDDTGFSGSANVRSELSSRSTLEALALTEITDTTRLVEVDAPGNPNDVQQTTDVIRNSIIRLTYRRDDEVLNTHIYGELRKIRYADRTDLSRLIEKYYANLGFPVSQSVSSWVFLNFSDTELEESLRVDKVFNVGTSVDAAFSRKLKGSLSFYYSTKESTESSLNYDEFIATVKLEYVY